MRAGDTFCTLLQGRAVGDACTIPATPKFSFTIYLSHLSQVIPRKDLPRIYTMCLPVKDRDGGVGATSDQEEAELSLSSGLQDLEVRASSPFVRSTGTFVYGLHAHEPAEVLFD